MQVIYGSFCASDLEKNEKGNRHCCRIHNSPHWNCDDRVAGPGLYYDTDRFRNSWNGAGLGKKVFEQNKKQISQPEQKRIKEADPSFH